jgi:hypothetical protein
MIKSCSTARATSGAYRRASVLLVTGILLEPRLPATPTGTARAASD